jgi:hypothetical protein
MAGRDRVRDAEVDAWNQSHDWGPLARLVQLDRRWTRRKAFLSHAAFARTLVGVFPLMANAATVMDRIAEKPISTDESRYLQWLIADSWAIDARLSSWQTAVTAIGFHPNQFATAVHVTMSLLIADGTLPALPNAAMWLTDLFRELFTETSIEFRPEWRTTGVLDLAMHIHRQCNFETMPILGDLLAEAGCADEMILSHARGPIDRHVRGCWLIDGILGLA